MTERATASEHVSRRYAIDGTPVGVPVRTELAWIPMDDGVVLAATLYMPDLPAKPPFPVVLESIPYRKDDWTLSRDWALHGAFAAAGYVSVRLDVRGTGSSTGVAIDEYVEREIRDNVAVIEWLAAQPWSTGAVGMFGINWGGFSALQAAMRRPPALRAIIPACFSHDRYHLDVHWWGGARLLAESAIWPAEMVGENALPPDPERFGDGWRDEWLRRLDATPQWPLPSFRHQRRDTHWMHGSAIEDWGSIGAAILALGGLQDWYRDSVPATVANVGAPVRGIVGPWGHAWPHDGTPEPAIDGIGLMLRWWDRWLRDEPNGIDDGPPLTVFVVEPDAGASFPVDLTPAGVPGGWWSTDAWPVDDTAGAVLHLAADGTLGPEAGPDGATTWAGGPATALTAPYTCTGSAPQGGPLDQRPDDARSLAWTGTVLAGPLLVVGSPLADLWVSADQPVAQVAVRLQAVAPGGVSALLARGLLNLTRRDSFAEPTPVPVDRPVRVAVPLSFTGARVPPGHRLRVAVAGSAFPVAWPPPAPVRLTVHHGSGWPSCIRLPASDSWAPAEDDLGRAAFDPGSAEPLPGIADAWTTVRDEIAGTTTIVSETGGGHRFPERGGLEFSSDERYRFTAHDDWASAAAEGSVAYRVTWPGGPVVTAEGRLRITSTAEAFDVEISVDAAEDGAPVHRRTWSERIPRDLV